jgi:hypothetical protein
MGLNEVFKKVSAINEVTELASHKVELTLLDDLKKLEKSISDEAQKAYNEAMKVEELYKKVNSANKALISKFGQTKIIFADKIYQARSTAKELGITLPREFEDRYEAVNKYINKIPVSNYGNIFPI